MSASGAKGGAIVGDAVRGPIGTFLGDWGLVPSSELRVTLPPTMATALDKLMAETGEKPGEVFAKAFGLYLMAIQEKRKGKVVGSASSADVLDTEFVGF